MVNKEILDQLLRETDKNLLQETPLVIIGGTALVVKYLSPRATVDVDSYTNISKELKIAWSKAERKIGVTVPLSKSPISEGPYFMEDRFRPYVDLKLTHLKIYVPEAADIILMKTLRLFGKDRDDISHLVKSCRISHTILLNRFLNEMGHIVGDRKILNSHYLLAIEDNFGAAIANKHEMAISKKSK